jgi:hypothetical protein
MLGAAADWDGKTGRDNGPIFQEMIAWAEGRPIRLGTGRYLASPISIAGPATLIGQGSGRTVLVQAETTGLGGRGMIYAESDPAGSTIKGLVFRDLALDGGVETRGFEQFTHLASVSGVEDVLFERVALVGFRGDGLYIGSGLKGGQRHNRNVRVRNCRFDGRNADNRNGISVLDIDGITIEGCIFVRCSRRDMPGAIDFEPDVDSSLAVIRNIVISNNRFRDVGGGVATICFHFAPKLEPPQNVRISGNTAIDSGRAFLYMNVMQVSPGPRPDQNIHLSNNTYAGGGGSPFLLDGAKGLRFSGNRWSNLGSAAQVGAHRPVRGLRIADTFEHVGSLVTPYAIGVAEVSAMDLAGSTFIACGSPVIGGEDIFFRAMANGTRARSDHVSLAGAVSRPSSRRAAAMAATSPLHTRISE